MWCLHTCVYDWGEGSRLCGSVHVEAQGWYQEFCLIALYLIHWSRAPQWRLELSDLASLVSRPARDPSVFRELEIQGDRLARSAFTWMLRTHSGPQACPSTLSTEPHSWSQQCFFRESTHNALSQMLAVVSWAVMQWSDFWNQNCIYYPLVFSVPHTELDPKVKNVIQRFVEWDMSRNYHGMALLW